MIAKQKGSLGISLCMIVRDEEFSIETALSSARPHVDQIIVVDTGSIDKTVSIAKKYADRLEYFEWIDDFSAARNYSLQFAEYPWILVLDADEIIGDEDYSKLRKLILDDSFDGFMLLQRQYTNNPEANNPSWRVAGSEDQFSRNYRGYSVNPILRLFKNDDSIKYSGSVHEIVDQSIDPDRIGMSDVPIHHYHEDPNNETHRHIARNLKIQERLINDETATSRDYLSAAATHFRKTGDLEKAEKYLAKALEMGADKTVIMETMAELHYRRGELESAFKLYRQLYDSNLGSTSVLNNLSNLYLKAGDLKSAAHLLQELLDRGVDDPVRRDRISENLQAILGAMEKTKQDS